MEESLVGAGKKSSSEESGEEQMEAKNEEKCRMVRKKMKKAREGVCSNMRQQSSLQPNPKRKNRHSKGPFHCVTCGARFNSKSKLVRHMPVSTGEKPFNCFVCDLPISGKTEVLEHMREHTGEKPFKCPVCRKLFRHKRQVKYHVQNRICERVYKCHECKSAFYEESNLNAHVGLHQWISTLRLLFLIRDFCNVRSSR